MRTPVPVRGQCRNCMKRRDVFRISRFGGGNYRRAGRHTPTWICAECVLQLVPHLRMDSSTSRYRSATLFDIAATLPAAWPLMDDVIVKRNERRERWEIARIKRDSLA